MDLIVASPERWHANGFSQGAHIDCQRRPSPRRLPQHRALAYGHHRRLGHFPSDQLSWGWSLWLGNAGAVYFSIRRDALRCSFQRDRADLVHFLRRSSLRWASKPDHHHCHVLRGTLYASESDTVRRGAVRRRHYRWLLAETRTGRRFFPAVRPSTLTISATVLMSPGCHTRLHGRPHPRLARPTLRSRIPVLSSSDLHSLWRRSGPETRQGLRARTITCARWLHSRLRDIGIESGQTGIHWRV